MNSAGHPDIGPELRALAQAILDRLDPAVRAAAAMAAETLRGPSRCQQVWCPVCALAALVSGEQHPMLTVIAEHSVALMTVIRAMAADPTASTAQQASRPDGAADPDEAAQRDQSAPRGDSPNGTRYEHIPIVIESITTDD